MKMLMPVYDIKNRTNFLLFMIRLKFKEYG